MGRGMGYYVDDDDDDAFHVSLINLPFYKPVEVADDDEMANAETKSWKRVRILADRTRVDFLLTIWMFSYGRRSVANIQHVYFQRSKSLFHQKSVARRSLSDTTHSKATWWQYRGCL